MTEALRLHLGAGPVEDGWRLIDDKQQAHPLPEDIADDSVEEICARHVLEGFSHKATTTVLRHWVAKLKPGGRLRIAATDLHQTAKDYLAGGPVPIQRVLMGCHDGPMDIHGAVFDRRLLSEAMVMAGLERLGEWGEQNNGTLHLEGVKPTNCLRTPEGVVAVMSAPRYGPVMHFRCTADALYGIPYTIGQGAYWHQILSEALEKALVYGTDYVLTVDYDSIFCKSDIVELVRLMRAFPEYDALCPLQSHRGEFDTVLIGILDQNGKPKTRGYSTDFERFVTPITTGHFGLTIFRAQSLANFSRPWFEARPDTDGRWTNGKVDADIAFWLKWKDEGRKVGLANRVVIGHLQELVMWPGPDFRPIYQQTGDYSEKGIPAEAVRCACE